MAADADLLSDCCQIGDFVDQLFSYVAERVTSLSCDHIVPREHVLARSVGVGPRGGKMEFTFQNRGDKAMVTPFCPGFPFERAWRTQGETQIDELGAAIANLTRVIPKGIVCFLPSYAWLDDLRHRWAQTGAFDRMSQKKKVGGGLPTRCLLL
jgi:chromosome transmission fidelity protein 1